MTEEIIISPHDYTEAAPVESSTRVVDAALPKFTRVGRQTELVVFIRAPNRPGLRKIIQSHLRDFDVAPEDVQRLEFDAKFPTDKTGKLMPAEVTVRAESEDFKIKTPEATLEIRPHGEGALYHFEVTPLREGKAKISVTVVDPKRSNLVLARMPLSTVVISGETFETDIGVVDQKQAVPRTIILDDFSNIFKRYDLDLEVTGYTDFVNDLKNYLKQKDPNFFVVEGKVGVKEGERRFKGIDKKPKLLEKDLDPAYQETVTFLIKEAYKNGFQEQGHIIPSFEKPDSGSTAKLVLNTQSTAQFYIKVDTNAKLAREVQNLRYIAVRLDVPDEFKSCFPRVFASKLDGPIYGYVMESFPGHRGFEKFCFHDDLPPLKLERIADRILDKLFDAYQRSINQEIIPNLDVIYLGRIVERLRAVEENDAEFKKLIQNSVSINGKRYKAPKSYLEQLRKELYRYQPPFTTFVHGDSHPENILIKDETAKVDIKFIDTKEWPLGDYMFDIGKFVHYLASTGPAELGEHPPRAEVDLKNHRVEYELANSESVIRVIERIEDRVKFFATKDMDDEHWEFRYALSMASNLLGLPVGRLQQDKRDSAYILYGEGLKWFHRCCEMLD